MSHIQTQQCGSTLVIRFDRADKKNALTLGMYEELNELMQKAASDDSIRVLVWSSTSHDFSAGNDIKNFLENPPITDEAPVYKFVRNVASFEKPMIAAVDGLAVGIGFTLLLHCDFVYTTKKIKLMAPFVKLGLVPELGSTKLLPELVGERKANEILILGHTVGAEEALKLGISNQVISHESAEQKALETATQLAAKPKESLRLSKELIRPRAEIIATVEREIVHFRNQVKSEDAIEALTAILEKRQPQFK